MSAFKVMLALLSLVLLPGQVFPSDQRVEEDFLSGQINSLFEVESDGATMLCVAVSTYNPLRERGIPLQRRLLERAKFAIFDYLCSSEKEITGIVVTGKYISTPKPRGAKWVSEYCVDKKKIIIKKGTDTPDSNLITAEKKLVRYSDEAREYEDLLALKPNDMVILKELLDIYREIGDYGKVNQIMDTLIILKRDNDRQESSQQ